MRSAQAPGDRGPDDASAGLERTRERASPRSTVAWEELERLKPSGPTLVTIGVFDGVHRGHQHLLAHLRAESLRLGHRSAVVTFRNHPLTVLRPEVRVPQITTVEDRLCLLKAQGIDLLAPLTFDLKLSTLSARDFVGLLREALLMRGLVVGPDFALGYRREGTIPVLRELGAEMGFTVTALGVMEEDGRPVRSTLVRESVAAGDLSGAAHLLGRPYAVPGRVERGDGRGRGLGFPTANLDVDPALLLPPDGVYATWLTIGDAHHRSATSIGLRPTFGGTNRTIETYVLDFTGGLYGEEVRLTFASRLRDELRFDSAETLVTQMRQDVVEARAVLGVGAPPLPALDEDDDPDPMPTP